ncbi:PAS domain S-box protein [Chloroflexota bacterium]
MSSETSITKKTGHRQLTNSITSRDTDKSQKAEILLKQSEENFRNSLDNSPLGIRIITIDGELLYANQAVLDIYGYSNIDELKNTPAEKRYISESYIGHQERKRKRQSDEYTSSNYEISIVRKDGEIRHLRVFRKEVIWNRATHFQTIYSALVKYREDIVM